MPEPIKRPMKAFVRFMLRGRDFGAAGDWHVPFISHLARIVEPEVYVELGIYQAQLLNQVSRYAGRAIGVDIDPACGKFVRRAPNVEFHGCSTEEFAEEARRRGLMIDLLFIDADHCKQAVLSDFRSFLPLVRPHGLILFHDTHPGDASLTAPGYCCDAYAAIEELQRNAAGYEMVTLPISPGLTICRKRNTQLSWAEVETEAVTR